MDGGSLDQFNNSRSTAPDTHGHDQYGYSAHARLGRTANAPTRGISTTRNTKPNSQFNSPNKFGNNNL